MLEAGIIVRSSSEWASPIVLVGKEDASLRLCVDYRQLNAVARTNAYPMPRIDDLIDQVGKGKYLITLDLARGYWQVPVAQNSWHLAAFTMPFGLYQFQVMPFGLSGAPATFQCMMDQLLVGVEEFTATYLDVLIIFSESWEDNLSHVEGVLEWLRAARLKVKPK